MSAWTNGFSASVRQTRRVVIAGPSESGSEITPAKLDLPPDRAGHHGVLAVRRYLGC